MTRDMSHRQHHCAMTLAVTRNHAHPDPAVRYLAHRDVQPVDRWRRALSAAATFVVFVAYIAAIGYAVLVQGS